MANTVSQANNRKMRESEYIIWECETLDQIKEEHPDWDEKTVNSYFQKVKKILEKKGFFG